MKNIAERHQWILDRLAKTGRVGVLDLCAELGVSAVTIRKDLKLLEEKALLFRSHGSAITQNPYVLDRHVIEKEKIRTEQKTRIAEKAASLVEERDYILLASGTTINEMARQLKNNRNVTVISASLIASQILTENPDIEVIQLGGMVRRSSSSVVGPAAEEALKDYNCCKLFLGVDGLDLLSGLTTTNALEASLNQKMLNSAQKIIVLLDSTKLNRKGFGKICALSQVDIVITDNEADPETVRQIEEKGVEVILV